MTEPGYPTEPLPSTPPTNWAAPPSPPKRRRRPAAGLLALALASALVGGGAGAAVTATLDDNTAPAAATSTAGTAVPVSAVAPSGSVAAVAAKVLPSVVSISVRGAQGSGVGTGFVFDGAGHIVTNNHVVAPGADGGTVTVRLSDGSDRPATIVGRDPVSDLAVIQVKNSQGLTPAAIGRSGVLAVGDPVVAFGSPLGLTSTVTSGIVSALNRPVRTGGAGNGSDTTSTVLDAIQTDAAINPGNSGGPLVNMRGEVVAINSAIATLGGSVDGQSGSIGLGFAIPVDQAKPIADELIRTGHAKHAYAGVQVTDVANGAKDGAVLGQIVAGGPAAKAGLRQGDVVTAVGQRPVTSADALVAAVRSQRPGDTISIQYTRGGSSHTATVTLGTAPF